MKQSTIAVLTVALALAGGAAGFGLYRYVHTADQPPVSAHSSATQAATVIDTRRPDFTLNDLDGKPHNISEWNGKVVLLNFWATWCPPCRHEIPDFIALQKEYGAKGLQVVGVALDQNDLVEQYRDTAGIDYPLLVGDLDAVDVAKAYGNSYGELPYTVFIDRQGHIAAIHRGGITKDAAEAAIKKLL